MFTTILVQPLLNFLFTIYAYIPGHDFGLAVIILTFLVRLILWPLVNKQLHSQRVMQQLAPEVAKVRAKAKGDKQKETELLMELYKEKGTNPFAPLLPLVIQIPIFFALYIVLRDSVQTAKIAHLTYAWVAHLPAVAAIIASRHGFTPTLFGAINLTKPSLILAVLAGAAQFYQTRQLQPKGDTSDQAKVMSGMSFVFPIITVLVGLSLPSALALYWAVTSAVAIVQQHRVLLRDAHELEERA